VYVEGAVVILCAEARELLSRKDHGYLLTIHAVNMLVDQSKQLVAQLHDPLKNSTELEVAGTICPTAM
jgi:hypothetical protein